MYSTVTSKGQVTIPKQIRDRLGIRVHDKVDFVVEGNCVTMVPVKTLLDLRGAVTAKEAGNPDRERAVAKAAVGARVRGEME